MTAPTKAQRERARAICAGLAKTDVDRDLFLAGGFDRFPEMRAALAAIIETQEACARIADQHVGQSSVVSLEYDEACNDIAAAIRDGRYGGSQ